MIVALAIVLDLWLAFLIVTAALFLIAAVLGILALSSIKRGTPPVPEQAIEEAKRTSAALRSHGARTPEQIRSEIEAERTPRRGGRRPARARWTWNAKLRPKLPLAAAAALGAGFVISGGIGATMS